MHLTFLECVCLISNSSPTQGIDLFQVQTHILRKNWSEYQYIRLKSISPPTCSTTCDQDDIPVTVSLSVSVEEYYPSKLSSNLRKRQCSFPKFQHLADFRPLSWKKSSSSNLGRYCDEKLLNICQNTFSINFRCHPPPD